MNKIVQFFLVAVWVVFLFSFSGCETTKVSKLEKSSPTFSISSGQSDPLNCNVQGEMSGCSVNWDVNSGILTHRQICNSKNRRYLRTMLTAMAENLKTTCALKIKYARLTTKDDLFEERKLAKMMSQSKMWQKFSQSSKSKNSSFPESFIKKVVVTKGLFDDLAQALTTVGYELKLEDIQITKFNPILQSKHFNSLKKIKMASSTSPFLVPENIRLVWMNQEYKKMFKLSPKISGGDISKNPQKPLKKRLIPTVLPAKKVN